MLSLIKVFCYRAILHSFIRLPPDRIIFLGIIKHGELDIRLTYAAKRRIFISLIIVVLLIIISFSLPRGYLCALVSFRIIIYHRFFGLSFYLWYKVSPSILHHCFHNTMHQAFPFFNSPFPTSRFSVPTSRFSSSHFPLFISHFPLLSNCCSLF